MLLYTLYKTNDKYGHQRMSVISKCQIEKFYYFLAITNAIHKIESHKISVLATNLMPVCRAKYDNVTVFYQYYIIHKTIVDNVESQVKSGDLSGTLSKIVYGI